jgi:3-oxoacyl-[acyl-carrier-protein] synthase III
VPFGFESVTNSKVGIGGVYASWGHSYNNTLLPGFIESRLDEELTPTERLNLGELGFTNRQHLPLLSDEEHFNLEIEVGSKLLRQAALANGWQPQDVDAVFIGSSGPASDDYTERISREAGIPESALKVSVHKACDGSVAGLNLAMNPNLSMGQVGTGSLAEQLLGKKVLVGGIEGLSRFIRFSRDKNALQLFGNGAGIIGVVPGESMEFLVGGAQEVFDSEGVLEVRMYYPHSRQVAEGQSMVEVSKAGANHLRFAGLMHEPEGGAPLVMAGPMGMVKLFVRSGVQVVREVYEAYQKRMAELGIPGKEIAVAIVHHANYKINQLKEKHLLKEGIQLPMPWLIKDFGNVSAASNMIAFLRGLSKMMPGDHVLMDGFGAGTYYDVLAVKLGG